MGGPARAGAGEPTEGAPLGTGAAPGKVILVGEHAVVYGHPAVAAALPAVKATASVWLGDGSLTIEARFPDEEGRPPVRVCLADRGPLVAVARAALEVHGLADAPWTVSLESSVPPRRGLGSSAAVSVAMARALLEAGGVHDPDTVAAVALRGEEVVHGTPSGIDHSTILHAGPLWFQDGHGEGVVLGAPVELIVADSGPREATGTLVQRLRSRREQRGPTYERWMSQLGSLAAEARRALEAGEHTRLGHSLNAAHLVLQAMRLSTPELDRLVAAARGAGASGAKLSGAGGGGVMVAVAEAQAAPGIVAALRQAGARGVWQATLPAGP